MVAEEQAAVIAGVPQAAFADNVQYQFRTENNGGQVGGEQGGRAALGRPGWEGLPLPSLCCVSR